MNRPADVVEAHDSSHRLLARFWVDRKTSLMVKRQLIDPSTGTARTVEFESLTTPARSTPEVSATATQGPQLTDVAVGRLRAEGWVCPQALPGGLTFVSADETDSGAVHMVYSDGLDVVSLFVQKGRLDPQRMNGMTSASMAGGTVFSVEGDSPTVVWSSQGSVLTLMSDLPKSAVNRIVAAIPPDALTN
jgi:sigma-E factor negative regulatory protein RseB